MASLGHIAVGMVAGRVFAGREPTRRALAGGMLFFSALSLSPDLDVIGFWLRVAYEDEWGHRGASHSIVFGLLAAAVIAAIARLMKLPPLKTFAVGAVVLVSHGLLDALTDGGLGCALLWPFSHERFFAPVTPIPVAPIGAAMVSGRGLYVLLVELVMFSPLFIYATFPRRRR